MIDALGTPQIADPAKRLFLKANEVTGDPALATSYLSATGWQTFETYLRANFASLIALRDTRLPNRDIPVFLHTYHHPTIRNAPAGLGVGPWLFSAAVDFAIPPALLGTTKTSGDWVNEIHLTWQGYEKVADGWVTDMGTVLV